MGIENLYISVAVCTYRRFDLLLGCLERIKNQTLPQNQYEIIVVDNSIQPEQSKAFRDSLEVFSNLTYIITKKCGIAYARNVAIERCRAPILLFTDDDVRVTPTWCEKYLQVFKKYPAAGVIGGRVDPIWPEEPPSWLIGSLLDNLAIINWDAEGVEFLTEDKWLVTANSGYRVNALKAGGGFCEQIGQKGNLPYWHAELDANRSIKAKGYDLLYAPHIRVEHMIDQRRMKKEWFFRQQLFGGASMAAVNLQKVQDIDFDLLTKALEAKYNQLLRSISVSDNIVRVAENYAAEGNRICLDHLGLKQGQILPNRTSLWPVIYIVTPCMNAIDTIDQTITSVLTQEGNFSIRYHIQDGGSTDGTLEKIEHWKWRIEKNLFPLFCKNVVFTYESGPDNGTYDAITKGFDSMYIPPNAFMTWINADDFLLQNSMKIILGAAQHQKEMHWLGGPIASIKDEYFLCYLCGFPHDVISAGACDGVHWHHMQQEGMYFKKWLYDKAGGLNTKLRYAGDWDLWRRFSKYADFIQTAWPLAVFRMKKGQLSRVSCGQAYLSEIEDIVNNAKRKESVIKIAQKGRYKIFTPMLSFNADSSYYEIKAVSLGERVPRQAIHLFAKDKNGIRPPRYRTIEFLPNQARPAFYNLPFLRQIYSISPRFIQRILSKIKHKLLLPLLRMAE